MTGLLLPDGGPSIAARTSVRGSLSGQWGFCSHGTSGALAGRGRRGRRAHRPRVAQVATRAAGQRPGCRAGAVRPRGRGRVARQDTTHGGFGGAPKFPPSALLDALLRLTTHGSPAAVEALATGDAMARGGIYDQLAGGFARYSVDNWVVPHFEKMLYDNALLLRAYLHWARRIPRIRSRAGCPRDLGFLLDALADAEMLSARSTPTPPVSRARPTSGRPQQLAEVLGDDDGRWAAEVFARHKYRHFRTRRLGLQLRSRSGRSAPMGTGPRHAAVARASPAQPGRDDKVVTAWNGWRSARCGPVWR